LVCATGAMCAASPKLATVYSSCVEPKMIALTFDDGPYIWNQVISDTLTNHSAKGTFFVNGNNWSCIYDQQNVANLQHAYAAGHQVASHTWSHPDLTTLNQTQINNELAEVELAIQRILGVVPAMMRPPYGNYNDLVQQVVASRNQSVILWDLDTGDSLGATVEASEETYADAISAGFTNLLPLNHETYNTTVYDVLPYALKALTPLGYKFVTVAECLGIQPYQSTGKAQTRTSAWTC